jgi:tetratricopeptide (TPR) repeat protein
MYAKNTVIEIENVEVFKNFSRSLQISLTTLFVVYFTELHGYNITLEDEQEINAQIDHASRLYSENAIVKILHAFSVISKDSIAAEQEFRLALTQLTDPLYAELTQFFPPVIPIVYLGLAEIHRRRKIFDIAEEYFNKAMDQNQPEFLKAITLLNRGQNRLENDDISGAIKDLSIAAKSSHTSALARTNLGKIYFKLGLYEKAKKELTEAIEIDPFLAPAYYNLGVLFNEEGKTDRARSLFTTALTMDPNFVEARNAIKKVSEAVFVGVRDWVACGSRPNRPFRRR